MLRPGCSVDAVALPLDHSLYSPNQTLAGRPTTASVELCEIGLPGARGSFIVASGIEIGVWEITPGTVVDVEEQEVFVVVAGSAVLEIQNALESEHDAAPCPESIIHLHPGSVVSLPAGARTRWTVTETLRKVYILASGNSAETQRA
jgi:uncharacterized cupin superfamily protein